MAVFIIMTKKIAVYIDGGNFYFKIKELILKSGNRYSLLGFNFRKFGEWLVGAGKLAGIRYYIGIAKGQSFGLSIVANDVRLIRPEEIEQFFELKK